MAKGAVGAVFEEEFAIYILVPQFLLNTGNLYIPLRGVQVKPTELFTLSDSQTASLSIHV